MDVSEYLAGLPSTAYAMFRGQSKNWPLLPSIARYDINELGYDEWKRFEENVIEVFARFAQSLIRPKPDSPDEWRIHAQLQGVPTRILDWTTNPLKALFFAVENPLWDDHDGEVWVFEPAFWQAQVFGSISLDNDELVAFYSNHINARIIAQEGCFVAFPLKKNNDPIMPMGTEKAYEKETGSLTQILVPKSDKPSLRIELDTLGIKHRLLFPDLEGVSMSIKSILQGGGGDY